MARPADPAVRNALIDATATRLAAGGPDAVSVRGIARDVGASTQAVYTYFGSKDDLLREVVVEAFRLLATELRAVPSTDDPFADLVEVGLAYRRNALAHGDLYRVMFDRNPLALASPLEHPHEPGCTASNSGTDPSADDELAVGLDAFGALVEAVRRCTDAGILDGHPDDLALQVWATAHGAVSLELAGFLEDRGEAVFAAASLGLIQSYRPPT